MASAAPELLVGATAPRTVPERLHSLERMLAACGIGRPGWLARTRDSWSGELPPVRARAVVPVWRRPWMAVGHGTFAGDVLRRLGVQNVLSDHVECYPRIDPTDLPPHDLVVFPDEPYAFTPDDGPKGSSAAPRRGIVGR